MNRPSWKKRPPGRFFYAKNEGFTMFPYLCYDFLSFGGVYDG